MRRTPPPRRGRPQCQCPDALPPLARDVHDRLAPLNLKLQQRGVQRALLNIASAPELGRCSDVLWMLRYLLPQGAAADHG